MLRDNTEPDRKARIVALLAMALAFVGGLSPFNKANGDTEISHRRHGTCHCRRDQLQRIRG